jgi:Heavy metal binding domain
MTSRRLFLLTLSTALPLVNCASLPKDATRRAGSVADPSSAPVAAWRPDAPDATANARTEETPAHEGDHYTCPMHPEVVQKTPGECPRCSMSLVLKKAGGVQ